MLAGLVLIAAIAMWYIDRIPRERLAALMGITVTVSDLTGATPTPSVSSSPLTDQVPALSRGTVAIQSFAGTRVVRSGAGTAVSADGLIITTVAAAPYGGGAYRYQIMTADGTVARAVRVAADAPTGLVLLKADTEFSETVAFSEESRPTPGAGLTAVSALLLATRYTAVILPISVPYLDAGGAPVLSLDRSFVAQLAGARIVDVRGAAVGVYSPASRPSLIGAVKVNEFVRAYLDRQK